MPTPCNLRIAEYPGSSEKEGREDTIDVFEIEHHIHQPVDQTTGQATGVRVHSPIRVVCQLDKAFPGLQKALCTGFMVPQMAQRTLVCAASFSPHSLQNLLPSRLAVPHFGQ